MKDDLGGESRNTDCDSYTSASQTKGEWKTLRLQEQGQGIKMFTGAHINSENMLMLTRGTLTTDTQKAIEEFFTSDRFCCTKSMKAANLFKCG